MAYLRALDAAPEPCFGLVRTKLGYVLLDPVGVHEMLLRLEGATPWGPPDRLSRVLHKPDSYKYVTEAELRRVCLARCRPLGLARMLRRHLPDGVVYVNVDHANATERVLSSVKSIQDARITLFLHDTIPLDYPEYQTPESVRKFGKLLDRTRRYADTVLCNSDVSKRDISRHMSPKGNVPPIHVAHLGVEVNFFPNGNNTTFPKGVERPFFVVLGTIEPRKNIGFLLALWSELADEQPISQVPHLVICGRRGWMSEQVFSHLDSSPLRGRCLHEFNDLEDEEIAGLLQSAAGFLFPSHAEGFGLPPVEAAAMGTPVLCNDLPVLREVLGEFPVYASVTDSYAWKKNILDLANRDSKRATHEVSDREFLRPPTWEEHFNVVLKLT
ncbi:MAG: glycosyltransferase family 1 protein [Shimia thalassica]|uniref:glycosyltransferase family 4 protein n=1 Tax=Shimia thalassica TaxID=1715693 RepID=UPI0032998633